ncbi:MAG: PTS sugar transporter subunit IIA [Sedimentisphaerales bacterium]|nr:PTS sugar transporter subunit IIA [Sedimentisphaerales bacterium]
MGPDGARDDAMPHRFMDIKEVAQFLGIDQRRAEKMAQRGQIPGQKVGGQLRFNRAAITEWMQQQMHTLKDDHLDEMDAGITAGRQIQADDLILTPMLTTSGISTSLPARTKNSVLKELVALAGKTGLLWDDQALLEALNQREELCSTAMDGGVAIPHPRRPLPYAVAEPILVVAHTTGGIGFGSPDGGMTDLFFLTCSQDDHHHLHVLARLCRLLGDGKLAPGLRRAETAEEMFQLIRAREIELHEKSRN